MILKKNKYLIVRVITAGVICFMAHIQHVFAESSDTDYWVQIEGKSYTMPAALCGEIFAGEEFIVQAQSDDHFIKIRFGRIDYSVENDFDFTVPLRMDVSFTAMENDPYYLLNRSMEATISGDKGSIEGSASMRPENEAGREIYPEGFEISFSLGCRNE